MNLADQGLDIWSGVLALALGYFLGAIPFGLILTRLAGLGDVRTHGSGNIGATNVLRMGGRPMAAATLFLDLAKGFIAVLLVRHWGGSYAVIAAASCVAGHIAPVWLNFKGGKGVATYLGTLFAVAWPVASIFCAVWILTAAATRRSSLAGLTACAVVPLALWVGWDKKLVVLYVFLSGIIFVTHRANITRLLSGEEPTIGTGG